MVQQISRLGLTALRIGDASSELARIASTPYEVEIGFDLETTGLKPRENQLAMIQFKPKGKKPLLIDARGEDRGALHSALLPLVTDARRTFVGQNLLFELSWQLSYLGFEVDDIRAKFSDTLIRELVILGLGYNDAYKKGLAVSMHALGESYGIPVHKEEQSWFINLDKPRRFYVNGDYSFQTEKRRVFFHADHTAYGQEENTPGDDELFLESDDQWSQPFPQKILEYARQDVSVVHLISAKQQELIDEYKLQEVVDLEARVLPATAGMQYYGLAVDREKWLGIVDGIEKRAEELAARLHVEIDVPVLEHRRQAWLEKAQPYQEWVQDRDELVAAAKTDWDAAHKKAEAGWGEHKKQVIARYEASHPKPTPPQALKDGVNLDSPAQILVAFQSRGHQLVSVKEEFLTSIAASDPVIQLYLDYKDSASALTKYGVKYLETHAASGVIYSTIQQVGAETGRFSFKEPNVQQVPARGAGASLRKAVVARSGYVFIDYDFSNVELRGVADRSKDPVMLAAFASGEDLHAKTAEVMFNLQSNQDYMAAPDKKDWTDTHDAVVGGKLLAGTSYRSIAKTINFGLLYGMGQYKLAAKLRIDVDAARMLMAVYRETYKVAVAWLKKQGQRIEHPDKDDRVYAATVAGRRRWFKVPKLVIAKNATAEEAQEALQKHKKTVAGIQRQLANHPIQGTSADITKLAIALWQERYNCTEMRLVCAVHDELLIECKDDFITISLAQQRLAEVMREAFLHYLKSVDPGKIGGKKPYSYYWDH